MKSIISFPILHLLLLLAVMGATYSYGMWKPLYNWDMIAYVAAAQDNTSVGNNKLSQETYSEISQVVSHNLFHALTTGYFRSQVYADPKSLAQQLPFYTVKVFYIEAVRWVADLGVNYPKSTYLVSAISASLAVLMVYLIMIKVGVSPYFLPLIIYFSSFLMLARYSTPDAMASFFALLTVYLKIIESRWFYLACLILPFVRPDLAILAVLLSVYMFMESKWIEGMLMALITVISHIGVGIAFHGYSLPTLFNYTFFNRTPYPASHLVISHRIYDYLHIYGYELKQIIRTHSLLIGLLSFGVFIACRSRILHDRYGVLLVVIPSSYVVLHLLLFPEPQMRFFDFTLATALIYLIRISSYGAAQYSEAPSQHE